jgi:hypothetical protein
MNATVAGLMTGLALGFAGYFGGFGALVVVAVVGLAGLIVGYLVHGEFHITDYVHTRNGDGRRETFDRDRRRRETFDRERPRSGFTPAPRTRTQPRTHPRVR